jgi:hypothetical protein
MTQRYGCRLHNGSRTSYISVAADVPCVSHDFGPVVLHFSFLLCVFSCDYIITYSYEYVKGVGKVF